MLANGDIGDGRMPDEDVLLEYILREIAFEKDLAGKNVLVTAGATREPIDPVRFITNRSTGKMGAAVARAAMYRGANVTLVAGHMETEPPMFVNVVEAETAEDMYNEVSSYAPYADIIIKSAAVADYTPLTVCGGEDKEGRGRRGDKAQAHKGYIKASGRNAQKRTVCLRLFDGDGERFGEFVGKAQKEKRKYDMRKFSEGGGRRFRDGYECDLDNNEGRDQGAAENVEI